MKIIDLWYCSKIKTDFNFIADSIELNNVKFYFLSYHWSKLKQVVASLAYVDWNDNVNKIPDPQLKASTQVLSLILRNAWGACWPNKTLFCKSQ